MNIASLVVDIGENYLFLLIISVAYHCNRPVEGKLYIVTIYILYTVHLYKEMRLLLMQEKVAVENVSFQLQRDYAFPGK